MSFKSSNIGDFPLVINR